MRNQTRQNFGFHSLMLYHWATETIMSEVFYEEVYYEVPSLIPHGTQNFSLSYNPDNIKTSSSSSMEV